MTLHIYQDRAEFPPTTEGKVIYSKLRYLFYWCWWKRHDAADNRHPAGLYS
jgi:hypothetical protein